jgi:hypothetical protein
MVTLIVAISVLISAWSSLGHISVIVNVDADHSIQEIAALLTTFAAAFLLLLALLSLVMRRAWLAGLRLLVGIWFVVSPWVLGHGMGSVPMLILVASGIAVVAVAAFDLYRGFRHEGDVLSHMS